MQILRGYAMRNTLQIYSDVKLSQTKDKKLILKIKGYFYGWKMGILHTHFW